MDPEILRELNDALRELENTLKNQASEINKSVDEIRKSKAAIDNNTAAVNNETKATNSTAQGVTKYGQTVTAVEQELDRQNKLFGQNLKNTGKGLLDFGKAVLSAESSLKKYGTSANQLGQSAWEVGKNFGLFGKVVGGVLAGLGLAANSILTLNQNIIDFRDGFAKQAGVLPITTSELSELAKEAGFAYNRMPMLAKTVTGLGSSLLSLGDTAGQGAVRFMNIANVGDETRKRFRRMGLKQEELLEYQSYYIEVQRAGGQGQANRQKTDKQIQAESLAYAENLLLLSALTGEKASDLKNKQQEALLVQEEQVAVLAENREIARLRERAEKGDVEAGKLADAKQQEQKDRQEIIEELAVTVGEQEAFAVGSLMRTQGAYTTKTAKYSQIQLAQLTQAYKLSNKGPEAQMRFRDAIVAAQAGRMEDFNLQVQLLGAATDDLTTGSRNTAETINKLGENLTDAANKQKQVQEETQESGRDPLMDAAVGIQELEIAASKEFQELLETIDPFTNGLELFKDAAIAAAAVIGGGALLGGIAKLLSGKFGKLGSSTNPMHAKIVPGKEGVAAAAAGGIGSRLKSMFSRSAAPAVAAAGAGKAAKGAGALAGSATGAGALTAVAGSPGGSKVGIFLMGLAKGLGAFSNPKILIGSTVLSATILLVGAAVASSTWMVGKALPTLAAGLSAFNDVDGNKIEKLGIGMSGLAAGLLAIGGSGISNAMNRFAAWATSDDSNPIEKLQTELTNFQNMKVDEAKVEKNSKAFIAFNEMVAKATEINGTVAGALSRAFSSFFEVAIPLDKFESFSKIDIDAEQVEKNATAFKLFSEAMGSYKGYGTLSSLKIITKALGGNVFSFFQALPGDDPIKRFEQFSKVKIEGDQIKINATAFKDFANAMAEYKGGPGVFESLSQLTGSLLRSLFGADGPVDSFKKFAGEDFGPNMERNVEALTKYANATTSAGGGSFGGGGAGGGGGGAGGGTSDSGGGSAAITKESVGLGEPGSAMKSLADIKADSGVSSSGPEPDISSEKDAIISYAKTLSIPDRAKFLQKLSSQAMQRATSSAASGNKEASDAFLSAANRFYMLSKSTESMAPSSSSTDVSSDAGKGFGGMVGTMLNMARGAITNAYASKFLKFTGQSGRFENFSMLDDDLQQRVVAAAAEYKDATGRTMQVNSGRRTRQDQERLYGETVRAGRPGRGPTGMLVAKPGHSLHERGGGIDLQEGKNDPDAKKILEKYGLYQKYGSRDPVHYEVKRAKEGGIFGQDLNETSRKLDALNPNSLIASLGKTPVEESVTLPNDNLETEIDLTPELLTMIEGKLEKVLFALENNQDTHDKILKNSM